MPGPVGRDRGSGVRGLRELTGGRLGTGQQQQQRQQRRRQQRRQPRSSGHGGREWREQLRELILATVEITRPEIQKL